MALLITVALAAVGEMFSHMPRDDPELPKKIKIIRKRKIASGVGSLPNGYRRRHKVPWPL